MYLFLNFLIHSKFKRPQDYKKGLKFHFMWLPFGIETCNLPWWLLLSFKCSLRTFLRKKNLKVQNERKAFYERYNL